MQDTDQTQRALSLAYGTFIHLGWTPQWAGATRLVGEAKKHWYGAGLTFVAEALESGPALVSVMQNGNPVADNQKEKRVKIFSDALQLVHQDATESHIQSWWQEVEKLREQTAATIAQEQEEAAELDRVMAHKDQGYFITFGIIGINVLVFILMAVTGVGIFSPSSEGLIRWGANYNYFTQSGEGWRLLTSVFVHIGIIHLLFNMYALFNIGAYLEPLLGRIRYAAVYLATGIFSSLTSLWWHSDRLLSAGASGAIFGLYGFFLALLTTKLIPAKTRAELLRSIGVFVVFNLFYGMKQGVDNAAHVGGLVSGFIFGYAMLPFLKDGRRGNLLPPVAFMALALAASFWYLSTHHYDSRVYMQLEERIWKHEEKALGALKDKEGSVYVQQLEQVAIPEWLQARADLDGATRPMKLPANLTRRREAVSDYVNLRMHESRLLLEMRRGDTSLEGEFMKVQQGIDSASKQLSTLF
jgi:rhomboid protease GluP